MEEERRELGRKEVGRESEENEGRWEEGTQELIMRGRKEAMEVDQVQVVMAVHMYIGFVICNTNKIGLAHFILTQVL